MDEIGQQNVDNSILENIDQVEQFINEVLEMLEDIAKEVNAKENVEINNS